MARRAAATTSSPQAARQRSSTGRAGSGSVDGGDALAQQGAEHAVDQPARAAVDQRQGGRD